MVMTDDTDHIRVLIIDNMHSVTTLTEAYLQMQPIIHVLGSTIRAAEAASYVGDEAPDVILLGLRDSLRADVACLRQDFPEAAIILLGLVDQDRSGVLMLSLGVDSYIDKMNLISDLLPEIQKVMDRRIERHTK